MNPLFLTFITAIISSLASAIVASVISVSKNKIRKTIKQQEEIEIKINALSLGMCSLLWQKIRYYYEMAEMDDGLTITDREALTNVYNAYHAIGGNGTGTRLFDEAMEKPIITD